MGPPRCSPSCGPQTTELASFWREERGFRGRFRSIFAGRCRRWGVCKSVHTPKVACGGRLASSPRPGGHSARDSPPSQPPASPPALSRALRRHWATAPRAALSLPGGVAEGVVCPTCLAAARHWATAPALGYRHPSHALLLPIGAVLWDARETCILVRFSWRFRFGAGTYLRRIDRSATKLAPRR